MLNLAVAHVLILRQIEGTRINFISQSGVSPVRGSFAIVQNYLLIAIILVIMKTLDASSTAWHCRVLVQLRTAWLLIDLHLIEIDRKLTIAPVSQVAPVVRGIDAIIIVVTIAVIEAALR